MNESEKKLGIMDLVKDGLGYISGMIASRIFPPISEGADLVMSTVEGRIMRIEDNMEERLMRIETNIEGRLIRIQNRIFRKISTLAVVGVGAIFLISALLLFLIENLKWSKTGALFSIGLAVFVIGLFLRLREFRKEIN